MNAPCSGVICMPCHRVAFRVSSRSARAASDSGMPSRNRYSYSVSVIRVAVLAMRCPLSVARGAA